MVHIGRQAVYDRAGEVVGYELLFRGSADAFEASRRGAHATSQVIVNAFTEFGLEQLVGELPCFVNLTRDFLVGDLPVPFDPGLAVLEVLETVEVDDEVVVGVAALARWSVMSCFSAARPMPSRRPDGEHMRPARSSSTRSPSSASPSSSVTCPASST